MCVSALNEIECNGRSALRGILSIIFQAGILKMAEEVLVKLSDAAIVFATLIGPVVAVQVQKWIERSREKRNRQLVVFEALMATRATRMSVRHIDALNAIPIAFYGRGKRLEKIRTEWNDYLSHLSDKNKIEANIEVWRGEQIPKIVSLIHEISQYLGFSFSKNEIENGIYLPEGHVTQEADQQTVLAGFARIFRGERGLPIWVNNFHLKPEEIMENVTTPSPAEK